MGLLVFFVAVAHMVYTPFTKVEESFNIQAMHDILYLGANISQYDHNEYPGVVPRTFLGPLLISITASPIVAIFDSFEVRKFWTQYIVRLILTAYIVLAWSKLRTTLQNKFGFQLSIWYTLITITQFHFMFYMSRPLPNIMALPLVLLAINYWIERNNYLFIGLSGVAIIIFRADVAALLGLFLIYDLYHKRTTIIELFKIAIPAGIILIIFTISIDSLFWNRWLWPEGEVLWFNVILNKSSDYGTSPFLWYIYSALPRAMGFSLFLIPFGLYYEPRIRAICIPAIIFILLYSILPHKELRFIIYVFPILNIAASAACHRLWINRTKSLTHAFFACIAGGHLIGNVLITLFLLLIAGTNYPGGVAMSRLHRIGSGEQNVSVHICNLAAQSGVSRFTEINSNWTYSKNEFLKAGDNELNDFSYILIEPKSKYAQETLLLQETHDVVEFIDCFAQIGIQYQSILPVKIKTKPCIGIMKKKNLTSVVGGGNIGFTSKLKENLRQKLSNNKMKQNEYADEFEIEKEIEHVKTSYSKNVPKLDEVAKYIANDDNVKDNEDDADNDVNVNDDDDDDDEDDDKLSEPGVKIKEDIDVIEEISTIKLETDEINVSNEELDKFLTNVEIENEENILINSETNNDRPVSMKRLRNKSTKSTKSKLKELIESHYRSKGSIIESTEQSPSSSSQRDDSSTVTITDQQIQRNQKSGSIKSQSSAKTNIKRLIKAERIKELVEKISKLDLTKVCDLERMSTKNCLKKIIDDYDEDDDFIYETDV